LKAEIKYFYDIDVFVSVRGGLTLDEGIYIAQIVAQTGDSLCLLNLGVLTYVLIIKGPWDPRFQRVIEDIMRWREDMNFLFEWQELF